MDPTEGGRAASARASGAASSFGELRHAARSAYALRTRIDLISFRNAWEVALDYAIRRLGDATLSRALHGVAVPVFYRGGQVGERRRYDERLAMFPLRYRDPSRYGKWNDRREWRGHPEGPAFELTEALEAVRQDAGLHARDIPRRFVKRLHELADKVLRLERNASREEF